MAIKDWIKRSGVIIALSGAASSAALRGLNHGWNWVCAEASTTIEIDSDNQLYEIVREWLDELPSSKKSGRYQGFMSTHDNNPGPPQKAGRVPRATVRGAEDWSPAVEVPWFRPAPEIRNFWYEGNYVIVRFVQHLPKFRNDSERNTIEISTIGRNREIARRLIDEAVQVSQKRRSENRTRVYVSDRTNWTLLATRKMRAHHTVILDSRVMEDLVSDAKRFLSDREWYEEHGIPHRRGYGLWGPPGTGKTSIAQVLAGELKLPLYVLRLSANGMTDAIMENLIHAAPRNCILLIEDIDAAIAARQRTAKGMPSKLTPQGLYNILDGVSSVEGRITIMTSNHPQRLDKAIKRPGRVDRAVLVGYASHDQKRRIFEWFFPTADSQWAVDFADSIEVLEVVPARVVQYLLLHRDDAFMAWNNRDQFDELTKEPDYQDELDPGNEVANEIEEKCLEELAPTSICPNCGYDPSELSYDTPINTNEYERIKGLLRSTPGFGTPDDDDSDEPNYGN